MRNKVGGASDTSGLLPSPLAFAGAAAVTPALVSGVEDGWAFTPVAKMATTSAQIKMILINRFTSKTA